MALVRREQGSLRPSVLRDALWLRALRAPRTGRRGGKLWLVVVPLIVATAVEGLLVIPGPGGRDFAEFLGSDAGEGVLAGSWGWFALIAVLVVFNTALGEEPLFRGYLLPRMNERFGRRDWLANGVLFAGYHLYTPWVIPTTLLDTFILSYPRGATAVRSSASPYTARRASSCSGLCSRWFSAAPTTRPTRSAGEYGAAPPYSPGRLSSEGQSEPRPSGVQRRVDRATRLGDGGVVVGEGGPRGRQGSNPVEDQTAAYQCGAHTPSDARGPGGQDSIRVENGMPSQSHSQRRCCSGARRKSPASMTGTSMPCSSQSFISHPCWGRPMSSGSQVSRARTYEATTSTGSRISNTLRKRSVQRRSISRETWCAACRRDG